MLFTGLLDKNGKEIYEGDIVEAAIDLGPGGTFKKIFEVTYDSWGVNIQKWNYDNKFWYPTVLGNIYENPELIQKAN